MAGAPIGRGAKIGASSVVTKDVAPLSIIAGMPGALLKGAQSKTMIEPNSLRYLTTADKPQFHGRQNAPATVGHSATSEDLFSLRGCEFGPLSIASI